MWTTVLMLTLVATADTVRIRTGVLFVRPLLAFWLRGIATSVALAVDVLFGQADFTLSSVHSAELASANSTSGHLQIAMVVLALLIAGLTAGGAFRMASGLGHA